MPFADPLSDGRYRLAGLPAERSSAKPSTVALIDILKEAALRTGMLKALAPMAIHSRLLNCTGSEVAAAIEGHDVKDEDGWGVERPFVMLSPDHALRECWSAAVRRFARSSTGLASWLLR
ncbi:hypothetical protein JK364_00530 [Streptomyces sp. 110]|uniref:Uncharacterized protein n=1 Tax=Streptomyces endocoffeicus TaxID=2898945 RepID=A0ABS1PEV7_9ACTN|nr:hypothetical protein [Streptomyces endocoffeicus]MBL1110907.1 hypothetical protein [Streptomyces endocoffeicus]